MALPEVCTWNDDAEHYYAYDRLVKHSRKEHTCCECNGRIPPGLPHYKATFTRWTYWEGDEYDVQECREKGVPWATFARQHPICRELAKTVNLDLIGECQIPFGGLDDCIDQWLDRDEEYGDSLTDWERGILTLVGEMLGRMHKKWQ